MGLRGFIFLFFALCAATAQADTIEVNGKIISEDGTMLASVSLHPYRDGMDISARVTDSVFKLVIPIDGVMQYNMRFDGGAIDIMLSSKDINAFMTIKIVARRLKDLQIDRSNENEAYKTFVSLTNLNDAKLRKHFLNCEKEATCQKDLHDLLLDYKDDLNSIKNKYKGTYTADVLCKMKNPAIASNIDSTTVVFRAGYFDSVPYSDENIVNNSIYKEMIDAYTDFLIDPTYSKEEIFVKKLMDRAGANPMVLSKTASWLFDALLRRSREKMMGIFISWYNSHGPQINNMVLETQVRKLSQSMPGEQFINIVRQDKAGNEKQLKDVVEKSGCTLLLFWSSDCSHCQEEMPYIKEMYDKYHAKGFDIYGVSLEYSREKWGDFITEKNLPWANVMNMQGNERQIALDYYVTLTPSLILINKKGVILHRFVPKNKLEKYIQDALK